MTTLVNKPAPDFVASAVLENGEIVNNFTLSQFKNKKYVALFFWPLDFTFVCPSEIIAHNNRIKQFEERNVQLIGVSIDSQFSHYAWKNTPAEKGGVGNVQFPMVADISHKIIKDYGIEKEDEHVAFRASFLIDKNGIVQHQIVNNLPIGREVDDLLRVIDALQFTEIHGEVCPAGWKKGKEGMKATQDGVAEYLSKNAEKL